MDYPTQHYRAVIALADAALLAADPLGADVTLLEGATLIHEAQVNSPGEPKPGELYCFNDRT